MSCNFDGPRGRLAQRASGTLLRAVLIGFLVQMVVLILSELTLDIGYITSHISHRVALGYWVGVLIVALRRRHDPTTLDLWFIRWGYVPLVIVAQPVAHWYWRYRGIID